MVRNATVRIGNESMGLVEEANFMEIIVRLCLVEEILEGRGGRGKK